MWGYNKGCPSLIVHPSIAPLQFNGFLWCFQLSFNHWNAQISGDDKKQYEVLHSIQGGTWKGNQLACKVPEGHAGQGTTFHPNSKRGLEVFVDANFTSNWDKNKAGNDPDTAFMTWLHNHVCRLSNHLEITTPDRNCAQLYWEWVYRIAACTPGHHGLTWWDVTVRVQGEWNQGKNALQGLWRQQRCLGDCKEPKISSSDEASDKWT